ncbi:MAG: malate synthase A [Planctomycetota bacterium]
MPPSPDAAAVTANYIFTVPMRPEFARVLTPGAVAFLVTLAQKYTRRVDDLLQRRRERQERYNSGERPRFLTETASIRSNDWIVAPIPKDLLDRRVEITGPVDRKMVINALNSGAKTFMADFEDSNSPTFDNCIFGQLNLMDAVRKTITFDDPASGKHYTLSDSPAVLIVRPRGWHLLEKHFVVDGRPMPAGLFDFGLYFYHNAQELIRRGTGPYFYLPKMQSHLEARLWNDVFNDAQNQLGIPRGTIKATVLIETIHAAFEMHEILYELREHSAGLNCGRWDYIFSYIKTFRNHKEFVVPDRGKVTMEQPFLRSYTQLLVQTCHRREAHAMGGMAAQIPIKNDPEANEAAMQKVRLDKLREATDGHDGTWVAHPALVAIAKEIFDKKMPGPNQIHRKREDITIVEEDLLQIPHGPRTEAGLRQNINVGIQYLEAWLRGSGCVPLYNLMEDAATAEISRTQLWQWLRHGASLEDGRTVTESLVRAITNEEMLKIRTALGEERFAKSEFDKARKIFEDMCISPDYEEFLTLPAYDVLISMHQ